MVSDFEPAGDQPTAIATLTESIERGDRYQTLLGITGSGKSATIAWTIEQVQRPTLVLHAREDEICRLASVRAVTAQAPHALLELAVLEDSYHMISVDNDRLEVAQRLAAHTADCLAGERSPLRAGRADRLAEAA